MSNIYIQEPPTHGKVLLETTLGDIDIELWAKETPKASRNFVQLCLEGYYDNTIFHRVVKGFIVQGGDPTGTGTGGDSIYGKPFKDEFHTRLRFSRRGLIAMANAGKDDNGSQFFFTLAACPELQNKHTIFGKVAGDTLYNMLKLEEVDVGRDERPTYPPKIIKCKILFNPFDDIVPRTNLAPKATDNEKKKEKSKMIAKKDFKLLSFGEEAEEDEEEMAEVNKTFSGKSKSSHDLANDPKLSSQPAVESMKLKGDVKRKGEEDDSSDANSSDDEKKKQTLEQVKKRLKKETPEEKKETDESEDEEYYLGKDKVEENKKKMEEIKKEIRNLKKEMRASDKSDDMDEKKSAKKAKSDLLEEYQKELSLYKEKSQVIKKAPADRESQTMSILEKFRSRLKAAKETVADEPSKEEGEEEEDLEDFSSDNWLTHKLECEEDAVVAKDANMKGDDWFDIYDPRNSLTKRRRENSKEVMRMKRYQ